MHSMIAPPQCGGRHTKVAKAQELGFDLGKEIEHGVEDVGFFREGAANDARDSATDFQLRRSACKKALGRLWGEIYYPSPPVFEPCQPLESMLHDVCEFLDDPTLGHDGHFLSATELQE